MVKKRRQEIHGRFPNLTQIQQKAPLLVVILHQKRSQLSQKELFYALWLLPIDNIVASATLCDSSKIQSFLLKKIDKNSIFSPFWHIWLIFVYEFLSSQIYGFTFLHSMDPNFMEKLQVEIGQKDKSLPLGPQWFDQWNLSTRNLALSKNTGSRLNA